MKKLFENATFLGLAAILLSTLMPSKVLGIPSFSRKYRTSCSTCHYAYPKLNAFGKAFRNNGYRYPQGQDPEMTKEEPVSLGAESYKRVWPDAIWPTNVAGTSPLAVHAIGRIHYGRGNLDEKSTYFEIPHEFELLFGGTFDENISYFGEVELEHADELAYEFAVQYDFSPLVHLKLGSVGLHASPEHHRLTAQHYNVDNLENQAGWRMRDGAGSGLELWGARNGTGGVGGFTYVVGVGNGQNDDKNFDVNIAKDIYGRATYKWGGLGETGGTAGQARTTSAFYIDNSVRLGGFFYSGTATADTLDDKFAIIGGDIDWWYNRLTVVAMALQMKSDYGNMERTSLAYFAEGNYVIFPWLIARARYEFTDQDTDNDTIKPATSLIPGVIVMVRANVKCSLEYLLPLDELRKDDGELVIQFDIGF